MIKNYLKIAFRTVWKNKLFSLINIVGLSIGLSASFVIGAIVYYDFSFDTFHPHGDRIFRITSEFKSPEGQFFNAGVPNPLAQGIKDLNMEQVEIVAPFLTAYPLKVEDQKSATIFKKPEFVIYTDPAYFDLFEYTWLAGSKTNALKAPNEVVLSEARAHTYFPDYKLTEIIGKTLLYNDSIPTTITGVVANFKDRTDIVFEEFISLKTAENQDMTNTVREASWNNTNSASQLFIKVAHKTDVPRVQKALTQLAKEHGEPEMVAIGRTSTFGMQPLSDLHLNQDYGTFDFNHNKTTKSVLISLLMIAAILLLLGCINFINLNTAQAIQRAKEIGIRKTLGSSRRQLIFQFLGETLVLTLAASVLSLFLSKWLLLQFSDFIPSGLTFTIFYGPYVLLGILLLLITVTLLSGFYRALILSNYKPISVLKQQIAPQRDKGNVRKYLTVFQFVVAQVFIIATLLVGRQLNYVMQKDMGFKTEAIAFFRVPWHESSFEKRLRFVKKMEELPSIKEVVLSGNPPASTTTMSMGVQYVDGDKEVNSDLQLLYGSDAYFKLYDLQLLAGRMPLNDTIREYVVNRAYLKVIGIENPLEAIGKTFKVDNENLPIVGVMQDFNQHSAKWEVSPMAFSGDIFRKEWTQFQTIHFKLSTKNSNDWPNTIAKIETIWKEIYPDSEFEYTFMDESIKQFYETERKTSILLQWATALAILISCLGLLGLVIHTTERRTKEIGIRKVLGATLVQLNLLLCKEFLILVGIAFIIATPIAWYGLNTWLEDFAYKTALSWWIFALSGLTMLFVAMIIMSLKTMSAAKTNPVKSLRTE